MTLNERQLRLRQAVKRLQDDASSLDAASRQNQLLDIGFLAASVDEAAHDQPNATQISSETDALVYLAEQVVHANDEHDLLARLLPSKVRAKAKIMKL